MKRILITVVITIIILSNISPSTIVAWNGYRNPLCLFTWDIGEVINEDGDGKATTIFTDSYYNYIHYNDKEKGDKVLTLWMYNPLTLYGDDLMVRIDL